MSKNNPYGIDKDYDIISFLNLDRRKLYNETLLALSAFGMEYEDKMPLNENLYCPYKTLEAVKSANRVKKGRKFSDKTIAELKDLLNLMDEHKCSYIRLVIP